MNTVTLDLERYHELQEVERSIDSLSTHTSIYVSWYNNRVYIMTNDEAVQKLNEELDRRNNQINELRDKIVGLKKRKWYNFWK